MPPYAYADSYGRRRSPERPRDRTYMVNEPGSRNGGYSLQYDDRVYDQDRSGGASRLVQTQSYRDRYEDPRAERGLDQYQPIMTSSRRRSKSTARFRDDASVIDDSSSIVPGDSNSIIGSRGRTETRSIPVHTRSKSRTRVLVDSGHDLESKTSRQNQEFRSRRQMLDDEEMVVFARAKSRERDRYASRRSDEDIGLPRGYQRRTPETFGSDDRYVTRVPRSSRRDRSLESHRSGYRDETRYLRDSGMVRRSRSMAKPRYPSSDKDSSEEERGSSSSVSGGRHRRRAHGLTGAMKRLMI